MINQPTNKQTGVETTEQNLAATGGFIYKLIQIQFETPLYTKTLQDQS